MPGFRVIAGDFGRGRALVGRDGLIVRDAVIPYGAMTSVEVVDREKRTTTVDRMMGTAAGGILGGVAAGAMAGGLTGPAGAVLGAAAGALLAVRRSYLTCRVQLRDKRWFIATGRRDDWAAVQACVKHAPAEKMLLLQSQEPVRAGSLSRLFRRSSKE